jgi:hypothetical protein
MLSSRVAFPGQKHRRSTGNAAVVVGSTSSLPRMPGRVRVGTLLAAVVGLVSLFATDRLFGHFTHMHTQKVRDQRHAAEVRLHELLHETKQLRDRRAELDLSGESTCLPHILLSLAYPAGVGLCARSVTHVEQTSADRLWSALCLTHPSPQIFCNREHATDTISPLHFSPKVFLTMPDMRADRPLQNVPS